MNEALEADAYKAMYHKLFHALTEAQAELSDASAAMQGLCWKLKEAQQECEELYLQMTDDDESPER